MSQHLSYICDSCETNYEVGDDMELPPHWLGIYMFVSNEEGFITEREQNEVYYHFCSKECARDFMTSEVVKARIATVDQMDEFEDLDDDAEQSG